VRLWDVDYAPQAAAIIREDGRVQGERRWWDPFEDLVLALVLKMA
jgi:hypothetical protein